MGLCEKISWSTTVEDIAPEPFSQHKKKRTDRTVGILGDPAPLLASIIYVPVTETY
jgi:hypothetical protein